MDKKIQTDSYKKMIDDIYSAHKENRLLFFIGAGVSQNEKFTSDNELPDWSQYVKELIDYWIDYIENQKSDSKNLEVLDFIRKKSELSNKRKVDYLYQVIIDIFGLEWFKNHKLDFEKEKFLITDDKIMNPSLLFSLCKLNAAYLTTNYDNNIERYLSYTHETKNSVMDIDDFNKRNNIVSTNTIVHLHGTPTSKIDRFVNSSSSYKKYYYGKHPIIDKLKNMIGDKKWLIVFIGVSMEEDEVLSLLSHANKDVTHYAFLRNDKYSKQFQKVINEYHTRENNTHIYWFGNNHRDLQPAVEHICNDVLERDSSYKSKHYDFLDSRTKKERILEIYDSEFNSQPLFDKLSNELQERRIRLFLQSNKFLNGDQYLDGSFWNRLLNDSMSFSDKELRNIFTYLKNDDRTYLQDEFFYFIDNLTLNIEMKELLYGSLMGKELIEETLFYKKDPKFAGKIFVESIISDNQFLYESNNIEYDLDLDEANKLSLNFDKEIHRDQLLGVEEIKSLLSKEKWNWIYTVLKEGRLKILGEQWYKKINGKIFNNSLFIRLITHMYIENGISNTLKNKIIKYVDFENDRLGSEFNTFVEQNKYEIQSKRSISEFPLYRDGMKSRSGFFSLKSFFDENDMLMNENKILEKLIKVLSEKIVLEGPEDHRDKRESIEFLKKVLSSEDKTYKKSLINVLKNNYKILFEKCRGLYLSLIESNDVGTAFKREILDEYKNMTNIEFHEDDLNLIKIIMNEQNLKDKALDTFISLDISYEPIEKDIHDDDYFDLFYMSSLGVYLLHLNFIFEARKEKAKDYLKIILEKYKNKELEELIYGFYVKYLNYDYLCSYPYLLGVFFSDNENYENLSKYQNTVKEIINSGKYDNRLKKFIYKICLKYISPNDIDNLVNVEYGSLVSQLLIMNSETCYTEEWVRQMLIESPNSIEYYFSFVLRNYENINNYNLEIGKIIKKYVNKINKRFDNYFQSTDLNKLKPEMATVLANIFYEIANFHLEWNHNNDVVLLDFTLSNIDDKRKKIFMQNIKSNIDENTYQRLSQKHIIIGE